MSTKYPVLLIEKSLIYTCKESWHSIFENLPLRLRMIACGSIILTKGTRSIPITLLCVRETEDESHEFRSLDQYMKSNICP